MKTLGPAVLVLLAAAAAVADAAPWKPSRASLAQLKSTSNDPAGDSFVADKAQLGAIVDGFAADPSLAGPLHLYLAANTAFRLGRVEDAGYLFYAAQMRRRFELQRHADDAEPDGNNAATYLGFLNQTTGMSVNPAIMRDPAKFAAVIARLEGFDVVPPRDAFLPEFEKARVTLPAAEWPAAAAQIKTSFLEQFGRPLARLLADPEFFKAFSLTQDVNMGRVELKTDADRKRFEEAAAMVQARMMEPIQKAAAKPAAAAPPAAPAAPSGTAVRVGAGVPAPRKLHDVKPRFPSGARGSVILDVTVGEQGKVTAVTVLRADPGLEKPAVEAVKQWIYVPVLVNGRPTPVIETVSLRPE
jgi:TonB family protein